MHVEQDPVLLDGEAGLIAFPYIARNQQRNNNFFVIYNFREETVIEEIEAEEDKRMEIAVDSENLIARTVWGGGRPSDVYLYNWRTGEITNNDLTRKLSDGLARGLALGPGLNINLQRRFLITSVPSDVTPNQAQPAKVTWEEGFTGVKVSPLGHLVPRDRWLESFFYISPCGEWASSSIGGYWSGPRNSQLFSRRVFFHIDERYPNGISAAVLTSDLFRRPPRGAFVNHPIYGKSFIAQITRVDGNREREYLRIYSMADVARIAWEIMNQAELPAVDIAAAASLFAPEEDFVVNLIRDGSAVEIIGYTGRSTELRIPPYIQNLPVAVIGDGAFRNRGLTAVTIPGNVTHIGESAFRHNQLKSVVVPERVGGTERIFDRDVTITRAGE